MYISMLRYTSIYLGFQELAALCRRICNNYLALTVQQRLVLCVYNISNV